MKPTLLLVALSCTMCWGQAADDCKPSVLNIPKPNTLACIRTAGRHSAWWRRTLKR